MQDLSMSKLSSNIKYLCRGKVLKQLGLRIKCRSVHIKYVPGCNYAVIKG